MVFSSLTFLTLFLPVVLLLYFIRGSIRWKNGVLLVASLLFYSWGEPVWVLAMVFSTAVNYFCALLLQKARGLRVRRLLLAMGVIVSLAALFYFKYAAFLVNSLTGVLDLQLKLPVLELPVGISFYTFQVLTYTVDVYRGKSPVQRSLPKLLLYISCFPQLIAGPIVQYADVAKMLDHRESTVDGFTAGMKRFCVGLSKKVLIANICGAIMEQLPVVTAGASPSVLGAWYGAALYALQLYFDFSGYSDMAIGLGRVLGFTYKENFNYPYISRSATEFWRRWHISLGSFFRDYVYIPLGGNRRGAARTVGNLLAVWVLTGLWHGASWNFVLWGLYYGIILILERFFLEKYLCKLPGAVRCCGTLVAVLVGWMLFYYTDLSAAARHIGAMFGIGAAGLTDPVTMAVIRKYTVLPLVYALCAGPIVPWLQRHVKESRPLNVTATAVQTVLLVLCALFIVGQSYNPFIYFRF